MARYNYIAGVTAFIYTIRPFDMTNVTEIGIKYKKSSASSWSLVVIYDGSWHSEYTNVLCSQFTAMWNDATMYRSLHVVVSGLEESTEYTVQAYKVVSGGRSTIITQDTFTTQAEGTDKLIFGDIDVSDMIGHYYGGRLVEEGNEAYNKLISDVEENFSWCIDMANSLGSGFSTSAPPYIRTVLISPQIMYRVPGGAGANSAYQFKYNQFGIDTIVHEMSHNYLGAYKDDSVINDFMEFATGYGDAMWKWQGRASHCYPIMSSYNYPEKVDNCILMTAWFLPNNI